jgi:hypothetical protein
VTRVRARCVGADRGSYVKAAHETSYDSDDCSKLYL